MVGIAPGERRRLAKTKAGMNVPANKMIQQYSQAVEVPQGYFGTSHRSREQPQASACRASARDDVGYGGCLLAEDPAGVRLGAARSSQ